jgi:outer membrane protein assembly factor BamB
MVGRTTPLYIGTNRHVAAVDPQNGEELWRTRLPHSGSAVVTLLLGEARLFVGHFGHAYALDRRSGEILWENGLPRMGYQPVMLVSDLAAARQPQPLCIGTNRWVAMLDPRTGTEQWRTRLPHGGAIVSLLLKKSRLFVGHAGYVYCLDVRNGGILWENGLPRMGYHPVMPMMDGAIGSATAALAAGYLAERRKRAAAAGGAAAAG